MQGHVSKLLVEIRHVGLVLDNRNKWSLHLFFDNPFPVQILKPLVVHHL